MTASGIALMEQLLAEGNSALTTEEENPAAAGLARALGVKLPPSFARYLALTGGAPRFLQGTDCNAGVLAARTEAARALLAENHLELPADAIVIAAHQGYDMTWILAGDGDASRVFGYIEGDSSITERFASFTEWLAWAIQH